MQSFHLILLNNQNNSIYACTCTSRSRQSSARMLKTQCFAVRRSKSLWWKLNRFKREGTFYIILDCINHFSEWVGSYAYSGVEIFFEIKTTTIYTYIFSIPNNVRSIILEVNRIFIMILCGQDDYSYSDLIIYLHVHLKLEKESCQCPKRNCLQESLR